MFWIEAEVSKSTTEWGQDVKVGQSCGPVLIYEKKKKWTFEKFIWVLTEFNYITHKQIGILITKKNQNNIA